MIDSQLPFVPVGKMKQKGLCVILLRFFDSFRYFLRLGIHVQTLSNEQPIKTSFDDSK